MGTDMYVFIETDETDAVPFSGDHIFSFANGPIQPHRDYNVYDALAGGRNSQMFPEDQDPKREPLFAPRGVPSPCSLGVARNYYYLVAEPNDMPSGRFWPKERCISPAEAEDWLTSKGCVESQVHQWFNGKRLWRAVSEPANRTATWLRLDEFDASLRHHGLELESLHPDYAALRSATDTLARRHGADRVRVVLWFDD